MTETDPVIVVGAGRSGTNLVRDIICAFPGYATWPCDEINYIWRHGNRAAPTDELTPADARPDVVAYIRRKFDAQRRRAHGAVVVEKTCATTLRVGFAHRIFPAARFVVVIRDGRDVAASARGRWTAPLAPDYLARKARFVPPSDFAYYAGRWLWSYAARHWTAEHRASTWGPRFHGMSDAVRSRPLVEVCALQWAHCVCMADQQLADYVAPVAVHRLSYEDLVQNPGVELDRLAAFLQVGDVKPPAPAVDVSRVGQWRRTLTASERCAVEAVAGPVLSRYGYMT